MSASYLEKAESELFSAGILPLPPPAPLPPTPPPPADPEEDDSLAEECCIWRSCWYIIYPVSVASSPVVPAPAVGRGAVAVGRRRRHLHRAVEVEADAVAGHA